MIKRKIDYIFLIIVAAIMIAGILFLATLSSIASLDTFGEPYYYLFHQLFTLAIGIIAGLITVNIPLPIIKKAIPWIFFANLLFAGIAVFGAEVGGASRWISIGNSSIQPSEFLKLTSILYLSALLSNRTHEQNKKGWILNIKKGYDGIVKLFLPFVFLLGISCVLLFLQRDLSTLGIVTLSLITVYFSAETPLWHTALSVFGMASTAALGIYFEPYRFRRLTTFLNPESDPLGQGFQLKQSILAIGSGGWFGKGLGMSTQKFGFLPEAMTDSIFAILGEEIGIFGCVIVVGGFIALFWRGIIIAMGARETFGRVAVIGICTWILVQTFMNMASSLGIWPLAGIPLPFFSYGGSHIIAETIGMAIILNISKNG